MRRIQTLLALSALTMIQCAASTDPQCLRGWHPTTSYVQCPAGSVERHRLISGTCTLVAACCPAPHSLKDWVQIDYRFGERAIPWPSQYVRCTDGNQVVDHKRFYRGGAKVWEEHPRTCLIPEQTKEHEITHRWFDWQCSIEYPHEDTAEDVGHNLFAHTQH